VRGRPGPLDIVLSDSGGSVEGTVLDSQGQAFAGARVVLAPDEARQSRMDLFKTANSDSTGHFVMRGVAPGSYRLYAWESVDEGDYQDPDFLRAFADQGESVSVSSGARLTPEVKVIPAEKMAN